MHDYADDDHNSNIEEDILNSLISIEEVYNAIDSLEEHKAPGQDRVYPSALRHIETLQYIQALFQCCFISGSVPKIWTETTILPIYKGSGDKLNVDNYREITLQSCIAKTFCKVLNNRLCQYLEERETLKDEQNGFRKHRGCQDHISSLYFLLENRKLSKLDTYCCFVDFRKAFDSVLRELLWRTVGSQANFLGAYRPYTLT